MFLGSRRDKNDSDLNGKEYFPKFYFLLLQLWIEFWFFSVLPKYFNLPHFQVSVSYIFRFHKVR